MPRLISALLPLLLAIIACSGDEPGNTPVIANMTPTAWPVGGGPVDLTILGSNFGAGSVVILNGVDHHTPAAYDDWVGINLGAEEVATARDIGVRVRNADGLTSAAAALVIADGAVPFRVDSVTPNIPELAPDQQVVAWLSQAALPASITTNTVVVLDDNRKVDVTPTYDAGTKTIRVGPFAPGATYDVAFTMGILSADGKTGLYPSPERSFFVAP